MNHVLTIFPFLAWLAAGTSGVLLIALWMSDELGQRGVVLVAWFVAAAYCQFFGGSAALWAAGLGLQTVLAVFLLIRWRLAS